MRALKERNPDLRGYVVEPSGAAILAGGNADQPAHPIQGGGYAMAELARLQQVSPDGYLAITGDEARETARVLAREEDVFAEFSSGANVAAALRLLD